MHTLGVEIYNVLYCRVRRMESRLVHPILIVELYSTLYKHRIQNKQMYTNTSDRFASLLQTQLWYSAHGLSLCNAKHSSQL